MAKNMSEIIQNISDIFSIISLVFSICCGKFFNHAKNFFLFLMGGFRVDHMTDGFLRTSFYLYRIRSRLCVLRLYGEGNEEKYEPYVMSGFLKYVSFTACGHWNKKSMENESF